MAGFGRLIQLIYKGLFLSAPAAALCLAGCATVKLDEGPSLGGVALPLGAETLEQSWNTEQLAPGLWRHHVVRETRRAPEAIWTWRSRPLQTRLALDESMACAGAASLTPVQESFPYPGNAQQTYKIVRAGGYQSRMSALHAKEAEQLKKCDFKLQRLNDTPAFADGPWRINILEVDLNRFAGRIALGLAGRKVAGLEPVAEIAAREGALAAVNGSFFVLSDEDGVVGDIAGLGVYRGTLISEGLIGRSALRLQDGPRNTALIARYAPDINLIWPNGETTVADGINRRPGYTRNCGNTGDSPTSMPVHDETCTDADELIVFDKHAGFAPDIAGALAVAVNAAGHITTGTSSAWSEGDGYLLVATGDRAREIAEKLGAYASVDISIGGEDNDAPSYAVNGAPMLLKDGADVDWADQEGWPLTPDAPPAHADAIHRWFNERNPRTAAGVTQDGRLLLVTVDGRKPAFSVGATIQELRALMRSIRSVDAINLDGGGSTTMVVGEAVVNTPSDPEGPRPVADALLLLPPAQ